MSKPRLLLISFYTEVEWSIKPLLEEWAEVASYDRPGVGGEPAPNGIGVEASVERALAELDRREWDKCVIVGDEFGAADAILVAAARPDRVEGLALGHACLNYADRGANSATNAEVQSAFNQLTRTDYRAFVRGLTQITQGAYDDAFADEFMERVPPDVPVRLSEVTGSVYGRLRAEERLRELGCPLLLVEHHDCLLFTHAGYEAATAAFPEAMTGAVSRKPSGSPEFAELLREFCERISAGA